MSELKRTPLFEMYGEHGGKTIDFGGWELPVQFSSIKEEHEAVRTKAGLFDVSHMGEVMVTGPDSLTYLNRIMTNDVSKLSPGKAQYTAMCYDNGGTVDDLLVYQLGDQKYLLVVNASNIEKDVEWLVSHVEEDVRIENVSDQTAQLAVQGPLAEAILQTITDKDLSEIRFLKFEENVVIDGVTSLVSRTGYTGEDGFEIYCHQKDAATLWRSIIEAGKDKGLVPCGLGARDTLRFEACLPLYGQELSKDISPLEAGIGFAVKTQKENFIGQKPLEKQKEDGLDRKIVGIEVTGRGIPRHGYAVYVGEKKIGEVTTGTQSPTLGKAIGLALLDTHYTAEGTEVNVEIRNRMVEAKVVSTPFYKRK
ncbi:glycine cleavage system protein T [Bacillus coahuilensis m2-6]|uniref:glycine cleavage system aminomethyltransferase GcvT n=1 Tax=Bacillus coahuilensis TaxID=408580 RepID=UPI0007506231|nr:glycine cleavage system aminomethyltransferase GcvT [Bacillus coahuilensis]KUP07388.1 glycine cleavage system protein T [Bacillus coahuilensis m2-6]